MTTRRADHRCLVREGLTSAIVDSSLKSDLRRLFAAWMWVMDGIGERLSTLWMRPQKEGQPYLVSCADRHRLPPSVVAAWITLVELKAIVFVPIWGARWKGCSQQAFAGS